jgi:hypothetical protein
LSCQVALGLRPEVPATYRVGVRNRWLLGDLDHLLSRLGRTRGDLSLPDHAPSRLRAVLDFIRCTRPGVGDQVLSGDDPGPFLHEARHYARSLFSSVALRLRGRVVRGRVRGWRVARAAMRSGR